MDKDPSTAAAVPDASKSPQDGGLEQSCGGDVSTSRTDLAARVLGGSVVAASDESFGVKENLLNSSPAFFEPGHYDHRGEIVDGWETRRRRDPGYDWALIRLGAPGTIASVDVDTSFFTGNYPALCQIEACGCEGYPSSSELNSPDNPWVEIVPRSPLRGDTHNRFPVTDSRRFTHLRLSTFPDGGVARLRVFGDVLPDPRQLDGVTLDLASPEHGGQVVASSDAYYSSPGMLIRPDRARSQGEAWQTRRRRDSGHEFVLFKLGFVGEIRRLVVDSGNFRYQAFASVAVYGCDQESEPAVDSGAWVPLLDRTNLQPDTRHVFKVASDRPVGWIRLDAFPDGGLSRVRVIGWVDPKARRRGGYRWFNALPENQALCCLADAGVGPDVAAVVVGQRPLLDGWLEDLRVPTRPQSSTDFSEAALRALATMLEGL